MANMEGEHPRRRGPAPRAAAAINPEPKNEPIFKFLVDLFEKGFPEKIVLVGAFGSGGKRLGPPLKDITFKVNAEKPNHEQLVTMSNFLLQLAQEDCEVFNKPMKYAVLAYDLARSSEPYERKFIALHPTGTNQLLAEARGNFAEDEEGGILSTKLMLELLNSERKDKRWLMESHNHMISGMMEQMSERMSALEEQNAGIFERSIKYMAATEQMLNQAEERKAKAERSQMVNDAIRSGLEIVQSLAPAVTVYLTKGKAGIVEGLKTLVNGLSAETKVALFGSTDAEGRHVTGILSVDQINLIGEIMGGKTEPTRMTEWISSLQPEQITAAQQVLTMSQMSTLVSLSKAAGDVTANNGSANGV